MGGFDVKDHMIDDALTDAFESIHMGITAENIATKYNLSREDQYQLAAQSQRRAIKAQDEGQFEDEIVPITVEQRKGSFVFDADEYINRQSSYEKLSTLRPAFKKDGSVTAGNSSGINDGASFMMLVSETFLTEHNLKPLAEIIGFGQAGVDPNYMGLGPVPAIAKALEDAQVSFSDIELFELNEAFAAQALGVLIELEHTYGVSVDTMQTKTNVYGGSIALGHPVGASGNRIIVTLLHALKSQNKSLGLASLCIGGGMGTALIVRSLA
jgi:acetyl-CoA C-acetyltransferase